MPPLEVSACVWHGVNGGIVERSSYLSCCLCAAGDVNMNALVMDGACETVLSRR